MLCIKVISVGCFVAALSMPALAQTPDPLHKTDARGFNRAAQKAILTREGVLKKYDRSAEISRKTGISRTRALSNLMKEASPPPLYSSLTERAAEAGALPSVVDTSEYQENVRRSFQKTRRERARIWGGSPVELPDRFSSTVLLLNSDGLKRCTGTLITPQHVLSAAHCACDKMRYARFGISIASPIQRGVKNQIAKIDCDADLNAGDLALITLVQPMKNVKIIPVASENDLKPKSISSITAVGFGLRQVGESLQDGVKFVVDIPIASKTCSDPKTYPQNRELICRSGSEMTAKGLTDTCAGDSGGPAFIRLKGAWAQVGVTSRGISKRCGDGGIYVKLTTREARDWLTEKGVPTSVFRK